MHALLSDICNILHTLGAEEPLNRYYEYQNLVKAIDEETTSLSNAGQPKKRKRVEGEPEDTEQSPAVQTGGTETRQLEMAQTKELAAGDMQTGRQIQYMFSKAPASHIPLLGNLLSNAVQTSKQWEIERRLGELITECLTTLIPEGENKDISITLWVSQREAAQVIDVFKL
ncbi:uncharacterized protein K441DRAFT_652650 [Cenococcum geophilum 1.58]|uniref:uncharacterized protein n=1 Tax=Cenococcum geophilum 1.58 TaxID=794803 RepID=UPI0035900BF5|nr:hypothetical protein K441DRAFT_652650 [Cenococcum geophilum 1.58]